MLKNVKKRKNVTSQDKKTLPYDKEFKVQKLKFLVIIVNKYQGDYYVNKLLKLGVSACFMANGYGTATREIYSVLGVGETKKDVVFALISEDKIEQVLSIIQKKFNVSNNAKGVAVTFKVDSIMGILLYRFFTDTKENVRKG